ncbi:hypothetical protein P7C70_g429, partial [Phenoliferia sp. Uapishka_3]
MDKYADRLATEARLRAVPPPLTVSPALRDVPILQSIFVQLPKSSLLSLALVNHLFQEVAKLELCQDVHVDSLGAAEQFLSLLHETDMRLRVKGFHLTKSTLPWITALPSLLPNFTSLTLSPLARISSAQLASLIPQFPRLQSLTIVGQDIRSRRNRLDDSEPEGEVGKGLRAIADLGGAGIQLGTLKILATPLKLSTLDHFLEKCGERLEVLEVESCGMGSGLLPVVESWCPSLRILRLDALSAKTAPPGTPRPETTHAPALSPSLPLSLPSTLTSLHLASLPSVDPAIFSLFATRSHVALKSLSFSDCDIGAVHLSFFPYVTKLRLVACSNVARIPVFVKGRYGVGPGCKELRQISLLGCRGLELGNLWELSVLGKEDLSEIEMTERERLGLGRRGVRKITIDGAETSRNTFVRDFLLLPPNFGASDATEVESDLPTAFRPQSHLLPFLSTNLFSDSLPAPTLLSVLASFEDLEEFGLFGFTTRPRNPSPIPSPPTFWKRCLDSARRLPILGTYISVLDTTQFLQPVDVPLWQRAASWAGADKGLASSRPQHHSSTTEHGKRLSSAEISWLLQQPSGKLRKVYV